MAAVQQRGPNSSPATRTAFIESMEEEMRRVAEHLERRSSTRRTSGEPLPKGAGYSFSQGGDGDGEEFISPRRRATVNHYPPRRYATMGSRYDRRESSPPERSSPPRSAPPDNKSPPTVFPEFADGGLQNGAFEEARPRVKEPTPPPPVPPKTRSLRAYSQRERRTPDPALPVRALSQPVEEDTQFKPIPESKTRGRRSVTHTSTIIIRTGRVSTDRVLSPGPLSPVSKSSAAVDRVLSPPSSGSGVLSPSSGSGVLSPPSGSGVLSPSSSGSGVLSPSSSGSGSRGSTITPVYSSTSRESSEGPVSPPCREDPSSGQSQAAAPSRERSVSRESSAGPEEPDTPEVKSVSIVRGTGRGRPPEVAGRKELQAGTSQQRSTGKMSKTAGSEDLAPTTTTVKQAPPQSVRTDDLEELRKIHRQKLREKEEQLKKMSKENSRLEREKWELLRRARDAAERSLHLRTQLDMKEGTLRTAQVELERTRDELTSVKSANSSLRALLNDLRAPRSSVDVGVQAELTVPLRRNRSIEMALNQGLADEVDGSGGFERASESRNSSNLGGFERASESRNSSNFGGFERASESRNSSNLGGFERASESRNSRNSSNFGGFERASESRNSSSTLGETWPEHFERAASVETSSMTDLSRETTPVPLSGPSRGEKKAKKKRTAIFGRMRRSAGKRGSVNSVEGLDLSQSSMIHGARGPTPIAFPYSAVSPELQDQWRLIEEFREVPFVQWNLKVILAWMEAGIGMGQYVSAVREKVTSGNMMMSLSDTELEKKLGMSNPLHRRKLRLAMADQKAPHRCHYPHLGKVDQSWVAFEWASDCGLPHLTEVLMKNLVDGRVLNSLSKEDIKKYLHISKKTEQLSFLSGVELLRMHEFNRQAIQEHRRSSRNPLYWTNRDVCDWLKDIGLRDFAGAVTGSGVHGALLFLERGHFTAEHLANLMHISHSKGQVRKLLTDKLASLFSEDVNESSPPSLPPHSPFRQSSALSQDYPGIHNGHSQPAPLQPSPGFYRTASNPLIHRTPPRLGDTGRHSLRDSALRSVAVHHNPALARRSATPTVLSGTTV